MDEFDAVDDLDVSIPKTTKFPLLMLATGILWILAGGAYCGLFALCRLLDIPFSASELWLVAGAAFFIHDGIQLIRGRFRDPLVDGIITILIGLFFIGHGFFSVMQGQNPLTLLIAGFFGVIFLIPGILVLIGRRQYLTWKSEQEL